jgi:hypothetical protein
MIKEVSPMTTKPLYIQIRERVALPPANHLTHRENMPGVLRSGGLCSYHKMRGHLYTNLANEDVQKGRSGIVVSATGKPLHEYVPLYFGFKAPMVAWNQSHNQEMVFLRFSLEILETPGVVVSDGNARSGSTRFREFRQIDDLDILDPKAILTVKYAGDSELKRKKQAEILVPNFIPISMMLDIICFSEDSRLKTLAILKKFGISKHVKVNPGWYFTDRPTTRSSK